MYDTYYKGLTGEMVSGLPLAISIFIKLREDILRGKLSRGEKLTEQHVCDEYNVSRTPVREAFRLLDQEGLLQMIPNRGAFVTGFSDQDIADMYDMRKEYEILAFKWAVQRMTDDEIRQIESAFDLMEFYTEKGDYESASEQNVHFHELIYKASHNTQLTRILTSYQYYTKLFKEDEDSSSEIENMAELLTEHRSILKALRERDTEKGIDLVRKHLEGSKARAGYGELE